MPSARYPPPRDSLRVPCCRWSTRHGRRAGRVHTPEAAAAFAAPPVLPVLPDRIAIALLVDDSGRRYWNTGHRPKPRQRDRRANHGHLSESPWAGWTSIAIARRFHESAAAGPWPRRRRRWSLCHRSIPQGESSFRPVRRRSQEWIRRVEGRVTTMPTSRLRPAHSRARRRIRAAFQGAVTVRAECCREESQLMPCTPPRSATATPYHDQLASN